MNLILPLHAGLVIAAQVEHPEEPFRDPKRHQRGSEQQKQLLRCALESLANRSPPFSPSLACGLPSTSNGQMIVFLLG